MARRSPARQGRRSPPPPRQRQGSGGPIRRVGASPSSLRTDSNPDGRPGASPSVEDERDPPQRLLDPLVGDRERRGGPARVRGPGGSGAAPRRPRAPPAT